MTQTNCLKAGSLRWRVRTIAYAFGALCLGLPVGSQAGQAPEFIEPSDTSAETSEPGIPYEVSIEGVQDEDLLSILKASSLLAALADKPPATAIGLRRRVEDDVGRLRTALQSEGYYASEIDFEIDTDSQPAKIVLQFAPGTRYRLASYEISYVGVAPPPETALPSLDEIGVETDMPARAPAIVAAEKSLVRLLQERGHPFAKVAERKTFVHHEATEMTVLLSLDAGPRATLGPLTFKGQKQVDEIYLRRVTDWPQGNIYDSRVIRETQRRLSNTGLFSSVNAEVAEKPAADGSLPVTVNLVERERRSIGAIASVSSDIGPGIELFWEHRNLFGENEKLRASGTASLIEQSGELSFRKPAFLKREQTLLASITGGFQDNDAYERQWIESLLALERPILDNWRVSAGVSGGYELVDEGNSDRSGEREFTLFGLPLTANRDTTEDPLDPASGTRLQFSLTPTTGVGDESLLFLTATAGGSAYYALDEAERFILAGRARVGSIVGENTETLPASRRFYAGGGGSIRGYEYQNVGPLDDDEDPLGGSSLIEMGAEVRIRMTEEIGFVPFVDGGTVFDDPWLNSGETLRWAAGLGFRYFTGFGPLRLDVAFPLNPRDDVDDTFQFYISFGQAF